MRLVFAVVAGCLCLPGLAGAQTDMMAMAHDGAANQLGVLEYCQAKGYTDGSAVLAQQSVISRLPPYAGSTAAAEATGKTGAIAAHGQSFPLSDMAAKGNTTEAGLCQQMAANVKQVAASNASAFGGGWNAGNARWYADNACYAAAAMKAKIKEASSPFCK